MLVVVAATLCTDLAEACRQQWPVGIDRRHGLADRLEQLVAAVRIRGLEGAGRGRDGAVDIVGSGVEADPSAAARLIRLRRSRRPKPPEGRNKLDGAGTDPGLHVRR